MLGIRFYACPWKLKRGCCYRAEGYSVKPHTLSKKLALIPSSQRWRDYHQTQRHQQQEERQMHEGGTSATSTNTDRKKNQLSTNSLPSLLSSIDSSPHPASVSDNAPPPSLMTTRTHFPSHTVSSPLPQSLPITTDSDADTRGQLLSPDASTQPSTSQQERKNDGEDGEVSVDVLLTHPPPFGVLDYEGRHVGSYDLFEQVTTRIHPKLHLFGHVHESRGVVFLPLPALASSSISSSSSLPSSSSEGVVFVNAATMLTKREKMRPPTVVDFYTTASSKFEL